MLYIVGTSIGNIQDTSMRATKTLMNTDVILAEDARTFDSFYKNIQKLFRLKPEKKQTIIHFHKENEFQQLPSILSYLKDNKEVALVSESGMPTISDPGLLLLKHVIKEGIPYTVIPGPTAFVNAVTLSGFSTDTILFLGFLPKKKSQSVQLFNQLILNRKNCRERRSAFPTKVVFYESPHRINDTLTILDAVFPDAQVCICREMTKKFEESIRGKAKDLLHKKYKGEIAVVVELHQHIKKK